MRNNTATAHSGTVHVADSVSPAQFHAFGCFWKEIHDEGIDIRRIARPVYPVRCCNSRTVN